MFLAVNDLQKKIPLNSRQIKEIAKAVLSHKQIQEISLSSIPPNYTITNVCNTIQYALGPGAASAKSQLLWRSNNGWL